MEASIARKPHTGEIKGTISNVTAGHDGEHVRAAAFARELAHNIIMIDIVSGYTAIQSMAKWARRNAMIRMHRGPRTLREAQPWRSFKIIASGCARRRRSHPGRHGGLQARR